MANYDRRILIPYLQDVCAAEMLCRKLEQEIQNARAESDKYTRWANAKYEDPKAPDSAYYGVGQTNTTGAFIGAAIFGAPGLFLLFFFPVLGLLGIAIGIFFFFLLRAEDEEKEARARSRYNEAVEVYKKQCATQKSYRESVPSWREKARQWSNYERTVKARLSEAQKLRSSLYSVNIIPSRYRTIHAAYYLYDYFNSCRESDLDKIIQTMLLDEIIQRLDKLIVQNQEIILNQRMQMAMQEQSNRMITENHRKEMKRLASMERNQELQMDYQNMIARNQEVTNFFLAAEYLRKL